MDKPKEAIERVRVHSRTWNKGSDMWTILAYLDWLEGKHVCEWPSELTRERLKELSIKASWASSSEPMEALHALAAIAPQRKKRVVYLFRKRDPLLGWLKCWEESPNCTNEWERVGGPVEIEIED